MILAADGKVLADSYAEGKDGKKENVGFPYEPHEVAHYEKAIRTALPKLADADVSALMTELKAAGPHLMLMDVKKALKVGETVTLTLSTDGGVSVVTTAVVKALP